MSIRVLLIEDNYAIAEQLCDFLARHQFEVDYANDGKTGFTLFQNNAYDVIILDLMLPDINGIDLCEKMKNTSDIVIPILMLTARDSIADKGLGFDAGADDYLTKPFELEEVVMRCLALAKRHQLHKSTCLTIGDLTIDMQQHQVHRAGRPLKLSLTDFNILLALAYAYPNAVSRTELIAKIWGDDFPDSDVLRSHIYTLRNIIDKPFGHAMIKTIHGLGFKLVKPHEI
ncbi:MAG: DNA-binding response OmpR family regulator [Alteromonadaceae bacterium]|jgi:DNA-binding response OmpR family regulator